jgi:outer membrane receptor protein involved in Fe transport
MSLSTTSRPDDFLNCTGLRFGNCSSTVPVHANGWLPISGVSQTVGEVAYEINVPLIKDQFLFQDVNFDGAARYTDYENDPKGTSTVSPTFSATTWKAGLVWKVMDELTLRLAQSRDIRAPNLYDLYLPFTAGNTTFATDYLLNPGGVQISVVPKSGGNPFLTPEVASTTTYGFVVRPMSELSLSVDAYDIEMKNVLYTLNGATQPNQLACYNSGGTSPLCQLQDRPFPITNTTAANAATAFYTRQVNIARQTTRGIDFEANYNSTLFGRPFLVRGLMNYQPHILYHLPDFKNVQDTAGVAYPQIGGLPAPVWKATLNVSFSPLDQWTVDLSERFRSELHWTSDPTQSEVGGVAAVAYTNVTATYDFDFWDGKYAAFINIQNLFDKDPPPAGTLANTFPGSFPSSFAVGDDVVGRYYTFGLRIRY